MSELKGIVLIAVVRPKERAPQSIAHSSSA
jgi:hypothetical protein